jgi:hypothetical protein
MLDAYLTGSVGQLMERARHLQASISRQLAVPKNLPPEFHTLAQTCRNEVNNLVFDLGSLLSDSRFQRADLQAIRLRAYKRIVEELDFLELVGVAALIRVNEEDRSMTKVVGVIAEEIKYPLIPPVVSCQSQGYFQAFPGLNPLVDSAEGSLFSSPSPRPVSRISALPFDGKEQSCGRAVPGSVEALDYGGPRPRRRLTKQ